MQTYYPSKYVFILVVLLNTTFYKSQCRLYLDLRSKNKIQTHTLSYLKI